MLSHRPGDGEAVKGGCAAADLIENDEGFLGGVVDDEGGLVHFDHEGRLPFGKVIGSADAAEDAVGQSNVRVFGGNVGSDLGHQGDEGNLANVSRLARHVGAGEDLEEALRRFDEGVVGDEFFLDERLFKDGVSAVDDLKVSGLIQDGAGVLVELRGLGKRDEDVESGEGVGGLLERGEVVGDSGAESDEFVVFQ